MNRLDQLRTLRNRVDQEIAREQRRARDTRRARENLATPLAEAPELIILAVADAFDLDIADISGPGRRSRLADARAVIAWIARNEGIPLTTAAELMGRTGINNVRAYPSRVNNNPALLQRAQAIIDNHYRQAAS